MNCLNCGEELEFIEGSTDSRQEWFTEQYSCPNCKKEFERRVEFKVQSEQIDSDELTEIKCET